MTRTEIALIRGDKVKEDIVKHLIFRWPGVKDICPSSDSMNIWVFVSILLDKVEGSDSLIIDSLDRKEVIQDVLCRIKSYAK